MARKKRAAAVAVPAIHEASLGSAGRVIRGEGTTQREAVAERKRGRDVVVVGGTTRANREIARKIEEAVGPYKREDPHERLGPYALPHFQQLSRSPAGHTFYETEQRKAASNS